MSLMSPMYSTSERNGVMLSCQKWLLHKCKVHRPVSQFSVDISKLLPILHSHLPHSPMWIGSCREVSEPSAAAVTEVEAESESPEAQQPPPGAEPEKSEGHLEEVWSLRGWGVPGSLLSLSRSRSLSLLLTCIFTQIGIESNGNK